MTDIIIFTSISMFFLLFLNSRGVRSKNNNLSSVSEKHRMERTMFMLSMIVILIFAIMSFFINWSAAPLFNIGTYDAEAMLIARHELYGGVVLGLLAVPRYIIFYVIFCKERNFSFKHQKFFFIIHLFHAQLLLLKIALRLSFYFLN